MGAAVVSPNDALARASAVITRLTRHVDDFPTSGVRFADLTPVLADPDGLRLVVDALAGAANGADLVAGIDARGFLVGSGVALRLGTGILAVRKAGKLPPPVHTQNYALEYGTAALELPASVIQLEGRQVLVVDDVLATGGTVAATVELLQRCGARVVGVAVVLEIAGLGGRKRLAGIPLTALLSD